jgi:hypothetical protein
MNINLLRKGAIILEAAASKFGASLSFADHDHNTNEMLIAFDCKESGLNASPLSVNPMVSFLGAFLLSKEPKLTIERLQVQPFPQSDGSVMKKVWLRLREKRESEY